MIPNIVVETITPAARQLNERFGAMGDRLERAVRLNYSDGTAELEEAEIGAAFNEALGRQEGEVWAREFGELVRDGFAVLQKPEQSEDAGVVFPWRLLAQPGRPEILSPMLLAAFGIGPTATPMTARAVMTQRFPVVPANVLDGPNLERLSQIALFGFVRGTNAKLMDEVKVIDDALTITVKPGGGSTTPLPSGSATIDTINQALACLSNATIKLHWWGPEICFDERCGRLIASALLGGAGPSLAGAFAALAKGGSVSATGAASTAVKAAGGTFGLALIGIGVYTGLMILANITPRGVCLQALWPVTGGFVWWAAGI